MSKIPGNLNASVENNEVEPDFFGLYTCEVAELLSQDEDLWPISRQTSNKPQKLHEAIESNGISGSALFSNGIGALLSEFKKERLNSLLRQSVLTLTREVDETEKPVLSLTRLRSCLRYKDSLLDAPTCKADETQHVPKKRKTIPSSLSRSDACGPTFAKKNESTVSSDVPENTEIDADMQIILENDSTKVKKLMKKHSGEILKKLQYMEKKLEELLDVIMTSCRSMTLVEKQKLRKMIQNLPPKNLERVVEIISQNKPQEKYSSDIIDVDLEKEDKVTQWRLYYYIQAVKRSTPT